MSVINEMLKNLEKRQAEEATNETAEDALNENEGTASIKKPVDIRDIPSSLISEQVDAELSANKASKGKSASAGTAIRVAAALVLIGGVGWLGWSYVSDSTNEETVAKTSPVHQLSAEKRALPDDTEVSQAENVAPEATGTNEPGASETIVESGDNTAEVTNESSKVEEAESSGANDTALVSTLNSDDDTKKPSDTAESIAEVQTSASPALNDEEQSNKTDSMLNEDDESSVVKKMLMSRVELSPAELASRERQRAISLKNKGLILEAIQHYNQALNYQPEFIRARQELAALYYGREQLNTALNVIEQGLLFSPDNLDLRLLAGRICSRSADYACVLQYLVAEELQQVAPDSRVTEQLTEAMVLRATAYQNLRQWQQALEDYQKLIAINPANARWRLGAGIAMDMQNRSQEAIIYYRQALTLKGISIESRRFASDRLQTLGG